MPETAIFRRLDESEDKEYLAKVAPVEEMDSTDSSLTGINSTSDRTTITVHRVKEKSVHVTSNAATEEAPLQTKGEESSSFYSNRTGSTNPVTPDSSIDAGDNQSSRSGSNNDKTEATERESGKTEREATPSKEEGYESMDSATPLPANDRISNSSTNSGRRSSNSNSNSSSRRMMRRNRSLRDDDSSSSDDDSSYFATHLPSPKSGRSFSISSNASNGSAIYQIQKQGSDASLSFSDESDEEHAAHGQNNGQTMTSGVHLSPVVNPNRTVVDMNLYPQRITRMHSVSSLVSSASSDNRVGENDGLSGDEGGANRRRSFTGDDSVNSSLPSIASTGPEAMAPGGYYVHGNSMNNYHPQAPYMSPQPSPGMSYYTQPPAPHLTNQQMMAWATTPPNEADEYEYTSSEYTSSTRNNTRMVAVQQGIPQSATQRSSGSGSALKSASSGSLNYVYSEADDDAAVYGRSPKYGGQNLFYASAAAMGKQQSGAGTSGAGGAGGSAFGGVPEQYNGGGAGLDAQKGANGSRDASAAAAATASGDKGLVAASGDGSGGGGRQTFKVYWQRWIMLFYMSILNLLSDWTCYSVAPISLLTEEAFGEIDPERLVVVFLGANAVASACEPMILARLGLRRTVLLGALLLTIGSNIKSGGLPPFMEPSLEKGHAEFSLYLGFFIVGLSQPLYQCTPALLSASWFPEEERTMATGVALNANQLGIGFAFIFGTLLVSEADDIIPYFGLLSQVSTLALIGSLIQFDDAPPTPPSASAKVVRGNLNFAMPSFQGSQLQRYFSSTRAPAAKESAQAPTPASSEKKKRSGKSRKPSSRASPTSGSNRTRTTRRRNKFQTANSENGLSAAPSSAHYGSTADAMEDIAKTKAEMESLAVVSIANAPSPAGEPEGGDESNAEAPPGGAQMPPPGQMPGYYYPPPPDYQYYQQMQMQAFYQQQMYQQQMQQQQLGGQPPPPPPMGSPGMPPPMPMPYFPPPQQMYSYQNQYTSPYAGLNYHPEAYDFDAYGEEGAEPIVTVSNNHLDIDIRDDQVIRSLHACMIRQGFSHALAAFTVSGIVINTLSTYMDYLVRLNGAPRSYTGIVGGAFQFAIMASSLIMGKQTDKTRAYYSVTTGMLVVGAFGLAECGVSLDSNRGSDLRWSLLLVAILVGPLQPISTELGVEVAYPLSENTVLVIQQLFSNLLSALFIPFFKSLKDIGTTVMRGNEVIERPEYTFSFYLLIVLHTLVTVYFATFNGRYLRYEHELQKKEEEDAREDAEKQAQRTGETAPLMANAAR
eukprot:CAMPEP_0116151906 /NCGR_PEP_ID=MMETSP0329-20121206/20361_1 /TAXON_ID=697910 /ORGANISM="Pseudo-nitzschia arenysensis, Strain B593" /LENGTH=1276 /DNA_ID=CAMNT_0003648579 /DNA_START=268 /DNA_END=4098 /DNA_ORIENTATION=+